MTSWMKLSINRDKNIEQLMREFSQSTADPIDLDSFCEQALEQINKTYQTQSAGLFFKQKSAGRYHLSARIGFAGSDIELGLKHPLPVYLDRHVEPLFASEMEFIPAFEALWENEIRDLEKLNAKLFLPLKAGGELVGILALGARHNNQAYTPEEIKDLSLLAGQIAMTVRLKYLTTAEQRWREEAISMRRALSEITTSSDPEESLNRILVHLNEVFPYEAGCIQVVRGDRLETIAARGYHLPGQHIGIDYPIKGNTPIETILQTQEPLQVDDTVTDAQFKGYAGPPAQRSWMGLPLLARNEVVGILAITSQRTKAFRADPARLELVKALATQTAITLEKARLFKIERQQRQIAEALSQISSEVSAISDRDQVLDFLLERVSQAIPSDVAMLFLAEGGQFELARIRLNKDLDPAGVKAANDPAFEASAFGNLHYLVNSMEPRVISDTAKDAEWVKNSVDVRSWAGVPVLSDGKVVACFTFASLKPGFYEDENTELLSIFASQAALALERFRLVSEVRELAVRDELTGMFTRRHFLELGEREFRRAKRFRHPLSLLVIDLDFFGKIKETFGQEAADQVLASVGELLNANLRSVDILGRLNGEEFGIILTETEQAGATIISDRLRALIAGSPIITTTGLVKLTASMGLAIISSHTPDLASLLEYANKAVAAAKQAGRNQVVVFQE